MIGQMAGAAISAIGNAIGNKQNFEYQKQLQKMSQDFNAAESQKNRDFQKQMFDETNEWNSAASQVDRLREAGLNPYLMMNGGNAGTASSSGMGSQASSSANAFTGDSSGYTAAGNMISQAFQQLDAQRYDRREQDARIEELRSRSAMQDIEASVTQGRWQIDQTWLPEKYDADVRLQDALKSQAIITSGNDTRRTNSTIDVNSALRDMYLTQTGVFSEEIAATRAQAALTSLKADEQRIINKYLPGELQARTFTLMAQGRMFEANALLSSVTANLKGAELDLFNRTVDSLSTALNIQNWFNAGYYGGTGAFAAGGLQRNQENLSRKLSNERDQFDVNFLRDTYDWRVNTEKWRNKNEKLNFARGVIGSVGDVVNICTNFVPAGKFQNLLFKPKRVGF